jgi:hypothetical protein
MLGRSSYAKDDTLRNGSRQEGERESGYYF